MRYRERTTALSSARLRWLAALAASLAVSALTALGASLPAHASDQDFLRLRTLAIASGPNEGPAGPRVTVPAAGGWFLHLGPVLSPIVGDETRAWCIQLDLTRPDQGAAVTTLQIEGEGNSPVPELALTASEAAWILINYGKEMDHWTNAAIASLMHANFEEDSAGATREESVDLIVNAIRDYEGGRIFNRAKALAEEARAHTITHFAEMTVTGDQKILAPHGGATANGTIQNIGAMNSADQWVPGVEIQVTLDGPAVFTATGEKTWHGESASEPRELAWTATGNGDVTARATIDIAADYLIKHTADQDTQNTVVYPAGATRVLSATSKSFAVVKDFQPMLTSRVGEAVVERGEELKDTITVAAAADYSNSEWLHVDGDPIPVVFEGVAYDAGSVPAAKGDEVSQEAREIGRVAVTADGPGTHTVTIPGPEESGFVTWVWRVKKADQGEFAEYIAADWQDTWGLEAETTSVRHSIDIDTALMERVTASGTYLVDDVFVTGFPDDHTEFSGSDVFTKDTAELVQTLYFFPEGLAVTEENLPTATVIGTTTIPAKNGYHASVGSTDFLIGKRPEPGTYVFVTSFEGDDRVEPFTTSVADQTEQFVVQREQPEISTTLTGPGGAKTVEQRSGPVILTDTVCYENLRPGQEYELHGRLMDKATGEAMLSGGQELATTVVFIPDEQRGCVDVTFTVDAADMVNHTTVAFETLAYEGATIAAHTDIDDEAQTVQFPSEKPEETEQPSPSPSPTQPAQELPRTGAQVAIMGSLALGLAAAGGGIFAWGKRRLRQ
ncbi:MAG: VaFE repeat-containing surface-anchored protein [Ancrocorticia sp.]|nr:VaFE repeat-containing surface-anchored protein [Ancrocorticia sp.]